MASRKPTPPPDYDPTAPLTDAEIKRLWPASEWFAQMGIPMPRPGRPRATRPKVPVTTRLDSEIVDYFKSTGPGWQTRMNDLLLREVRKKKRA